MTFCLLMPFHLCRTKWDTLCSWGERVPSRLQCQMTATPTRYHPIAQLLHRCPSIPAFLWRCCRSASALILVLVCSCLRFTKKSLPALLAHQERYFWLKIYQWRISQRIVPFNYSTSGLFRAFSGLLRPAVKSFALQFPNELARRQSMIGGDI